MKKQTGTKNAYLKIVRLGFCPKCLERGSIDGCSETGRTIHFHCENKKCSEYQKDMTMPIEVFDLLYYLEDHQPNCAEDEDDESGALDREE